MNASKIGTSELSGWRVACKNLLKSVRRTQPELHTSLLRQYTIAMATIANQLNMNVDAPGRMFEG